MRVTFTTTEPATLKAVLRYEFHGILHFELHYTKPGDAPQTIRIQKIASHQIYPNPQAGDAIVIHALMGMIHQITKAQSQ
ncbi:MAG: hypothetical protein ACKVS6_01205 [Planctomycetota bacterium]